MSDKGAGVRNGHARFGVLDVVRMAIGAGIGLWLLAKAGAWMGLQPRVSRDRGADLQPSQYWAEHGMEIPHVFTATELSQYSAGTGGTRPVLLAVLGHVYEVTRAPRLYGTKGPYRRFTGRDCSNLFGYAMWELGAMRAAACSSNVSNTTEVQLQRIRGWQRFYQERYPYVGVLV
ncbi:AER144Cp [Eremothecium gossypii ATCC 10895]|uniref:AER144Cp n=1 Tax=Eremothecium gossypii (strain ATCC 10895 / CBS 109.51 / FGSC 9923 / NRRL Y-1056) TaxID=284811 RepID=Q756V7_EREGS|nr:AER144Cp [Eremothecium gossypii ATCC 10895]AAS52827.1 AER144Cp [Eremothecium gossypii ATCC 10895]AEY97133.1 FAER144Cp [Eremothecium gossypii FDAG1]